MQEEKRQVKAMGTIIQLWIQHEDPTPILEAAVQQIRAFEKRFSANDPASDLMKVNQNAGIQPTKVAKDLFALIALAKEHSLPEDSFLNIAMGPLVQEWRIGFSDAKVPTAEKVTELLQVTDPQQIELDDQQQTVALAAGMSIDLGAVAKGYFADQLADFFKQSGVNAALIDLGGNVVTFGETPNHADHLWRIGIQNPFLPRGNFVAALKIRDRSIVTSGIYERSHTVDGKTYHHIFDRKTGYPIESALASITIISDRSVDGEIWTTRLFGKKPEEIMKQLSQLDGITGLIVTRQGQLLYPSTLQPLIELPETNQKS
ncbi:FAD:protein FMN transferase [Enterococcus gallinarum]|uniref:FAD:protein FMN transferase n=1 Tax=Enterococcus gallinarum TaxID=1353 RepID=A0A376GUM1_ENTGA|nr:FAD:protein FMN transferase [Enterococcus gallinarum]OJG48577.1 thiamine biosynthesis protein ApbE [Enterococcus gallinarum]STD73133.1 putative thiamine biosynthesis lipoprotein [Enterococcus gallinarum]STD82237.1 putative thiamine biosynthesis lipoprotein [Enterococcus gallinarum]